MTVGVSQEVFVHNTGRGERKCCPTTHNFVLCPMITINNYDLKRPVTYYHWHENDHSQTQ